MIEILQRIKEVLLLIFLFFYPCQLFVENMSLIDKIILQCRLFFPGLPEYLLLTIREDRWICF